MNKIYKVIWNKSTGKWIVTSERSKSCIKQGRIILAKGKIVEFPQSSIFLNTIFTVLASFIFISSSLAQGQNGKLASLSNISNSPLGCKNQVSSGNVSNNDFTQYSVAIGCLNTIHISGNLPINRTILDHRVPQIDKLPIYPFPTGNKTILSSALTLGVSNSVMSSGGGLAIGGHNKIHKNTSYSIAVGHSNLVSDYYSSALGIGNLVTKNSAIAIGVANKAEGVISIAMGRQSYALGDKSIAVGSIATASSLNSIAIGTKATSTAKNAISIGENANSNHINSIALGADSVTLSSITPAFLTGKIPSQIDGVVSIGNKNISRRLQNVADGSQDFDAVNVQQLKEAQKNLENILGQSAKNSNGNIIGNNIAGTGKNTIDAAIRAVKTELKANNESIFLDKTIDKDGEATYQLDLSPSAKSALVAGKNAQKSIQEQGIIFKGDTGQTGAQKLGEQLSIQGADSNIKTQADGQGLKIQLAKQVNLTQEGSLSIGNVLVKNNKLQVGETVLSKGVLSGLENRNLNSKDFAQSGRAATEEQLKQVIDQQGTASQTTVSYTKNKDSGMTNYDQVILSGRHLSLIQDPISQEWKMTGGTSISNLASAGDYKNQANAGKAINAGDLNNAVHHVLTKGMIFAANSGKATQLQLGQTLRIKGDDKNTHFENSDKGKNIFTQVDTKGLIRLGLARNLDLGTQGSISIDRTIIQNNVITGLANTTWDINKIRLDQAATEGQLQQAITGLKLEFKTAEKQRDESSQLNNQKINLAPENASVISSTAISPFKDGKVSPDSKEIITGRQLWDTQQKISENQREILNLQQRVIQQQSGLIEIDETSSDIMIAQNSVGTNINMSGSKGDRILSGVASGVKENDVATMGQLQSSYTELSQSLGGGAFYDAANKSYRPPQYQVGNSRLNNVGSAVNALNKADQIITQQVINLEAKFKNALFATNKKVDQIIKQANAGIAAAMAMESAPYIAGKYTYAIGAAHHGGESAVGMTFRRTADSGQWAITGGIATATEGSPSMRIGVSGIFD